MAVALFLFAINFAAEGSRVSADNDHEERYEHHEGREDDDSFEDIGQIAGWGTVMAMGAAGLIFPIRRSMKSVIKNLPPAKKLFISLSMFFGKYHIVAGVLALALGVFHGVTMYLSEGELEGEGIIGLAAVILMAIVGILGTILFKKKKLKTLRTAHITLITLAIVVGLVHIFAS